MQRLLHILATAKDAAKKYLSQLFRRATMTTADILSNSDDREAEIKELDRMLSALGTATDDLFTQEEQDPRAEQYGYSLGISQPVYYVVASANEHKLLTMNALKDRVVRDTLTNLKDKSEGRWEKHDDDLFGPHTFLVMTCADQNTPSLAIDAWQNYIQKAVEACEAELSKAGTRVRLHKGAILHNVGVCHLLAGDLDSAFQLLSAAGNEDHLSGRGNWENVVLGNHVLTEPRLIKPLIDFANMESDWSNTYASTLSKPFDSNELKALLAWLAIKEEDAIQLLHALHRFVMSCKNYPSRVQPHIQVRATADIILVIESSLRRWQTGVTGQLFDRMKTVLPNTTIAGQAFKDAHDAFCMAFPGSDPDKDTEKGINWAINDCLTRFQAETSSARRAGIVGYLAVRLRNSLMHVILGNVSLYQNEAERLKVVGMMLTVVGLSKAANEGTVPPT